MQALPKSNQKPGQVKLDNRKPYSKPPAADTVSLKEDSNILTRKGQRYTYKTQVGVTTMGREDVLIVDKHMAEDAPRAQRMTFDEDGVIAFLEAIKLSPTLSKLLTLTSTAPNPHVTASSSRSTGRSANTGIANGMVPHSTHVQLSQPDDSLVPAQESQQRAPGGSTAAIAKPTVRDWLEAVHLERKLRELYTL